MEFWMWNAGRQELEGLKVEGIESDLAPDF
jgi:hypothetical protein